MDMLERYKAELAEVNEALSRCFLKAENNGRLLDSMRYSLLAGGKRVRPVLVLEFARACGAEERAAMPFACAVEMLHTYSLIHDDLPCMDDDELRRGKPTNHVVYGEWLATVAGDALQAAAFEAILSSVLPSDTRCAAAKVLAEAAGANGMCGGQYLDMEFEDKSPGLKELEHVHSMKTAAMIKASCLIGCIAGGATEKQMAAAAEYSEAVGLAFQLVDDLLDMESSTEKLGKPVGSDEKNSKATFASLLGKDQCRDMIAELTERAEKAVSDAFDDAEFLKWFAGMLAGRNN